MNFKSLCDKFAGWSICLLALSAANQASAEVLEDFESYPLGTEIPLWNCWGNAATTSKAVVEKDPTNANNKVLHVTVKAWGTFPSATLPENLAGAALVEQKESVSFRFYRTSADVNDYKKMQIYQGSTLLFEDEGYPHQGNIGSWQNRTYQLNKANPGTGNVLAAGINTDNSDYLIDDISVKGQYDDYLIVTGQETIDVSAQNTSSSYKTIAQPIRIESTGQLKLVTARYTYITSTLEGDGRLDIYSGGERTYIGGSDKKWPNWSSFRGDVHVFPYKNLSSGNGFYGLVWMHGGKTFNPDNLLIDIEDGKAMNSFAKSRLTLHAGTTLAAESGVRAMRIGRLEMEEGSTLYGYMKNKDSNHSYYIVGGNNEDATLAGKIAPFEGNSNMQVGLVKEGLGTYHITGANNNISGGIRVLRGGVNLTQNNQVQSILCYKEGVVAAQATQKTQLNLYGRLLPGGSQVGTLTLDKTTSSATPLILRPTGRIECQIISSDTYDQLKINGTVSYYNIDQEFATSEQMPRLRIQVPAESQLSVGDEFVLFQASGKSSYQDVPWEFDVIYPKAYTWNVLQTVDDASGSFKVVAQVTSLSYGGQGDREDFDESDDTSTDDGVFDLKAEMADHRPLRSFVDGHSLYVGTCVPVWRIDLNNDNDQRSKLIAQEYNMVVCENEMKFDATEPNQNQFNYTNGDVFVRYASRHNLYVRGHALVWHSQLPSWVSSDGYKNDRNWTRQQLLDIMKNHIKNVARHWKSNIQEWDVCNEVLDDNQQTIYSNPNAYDLRKSVWLNVIGEDFIDSAFVWAHQYAPDAKLILNDYGVEGKGWGKSEALYNLAKRLRASNIPIDGVGLQSHMDANLNYFGDIEKNIARYQQEGFLCHITELDLGIDSNTESVLEQQAQAYYRLMRIAMKYDNCCSVMIWGLSDDLTWREGKRPLLYDASLNAKPAYWGVHAALRQAVGEELPTAIEQLVPDETPTLSFADLLRSGAPVFDLMGRRVAHPVAGRIYIVRGQKVRF